MESSDVRRALEDAVRKSGASYAGLSKMLGRNAAYLQQFVKRGSPARLGERDRHLLCQFFGIDEAELGGPAAVSPSTRYIRRLDVRASAGPGALADAEATLQQIGFDQAWLRRISRGRDEDLSIIEVIGDSMAPTLSDGDDILVDCSVANDRVREGIYVMRRDGELMVKRLSTSPADGTLTIASDNPAYPTWTGCHANSIDIIGRVLWAGRKFV
jgi:phage repressor protein C with HTH and peptisase S24 domain